MRENTPRKSDAAVFQIGCWEFDLAARNLTDRIRTRRLTPKAAAVLAALAEAEGSVLTRIELLDRVWPDADVCEEALTHSIAEIRRAIGDKGEQRIIETVHGTGYRLRHPVRIISGRALERIADRDEDFDLEAYLDCAEARRMCEQNGERALGRAVELCGRAAARAPRCAPILSEFASLAAMRRLYHDDGGPGVQDFLKAADAAARLRPDLACGHVSRGVVLAAVGRKSAAYAAFNQAIMCDPREFQAHYHYARALFAFGERAKAVRMAECAAALRSDDYRPLFLVAASCSALGEPTRARSAALAGLARLDVRVASGDGGTRAGGALGLFLALTGRREDAYRSITAHESEQDPMLYYGVAAYAAMGEVEIALDRLERVVDHGFRHAEWLRSDPTLEPLRQVPRFTRLMAALDPV